VLDALGDLDIAVPNTQALLLECAGMTEI